MAPASGQPGTSEPCRQAEEGAGLPVLSDPSVLISGRVFSYIIIERLVNYARGGWLDAFGRVLSPAVPANGTDRRNEIKPEMVLLLFLVSLKTSPYTSFCALVFHAH
jgi:hypothetical protein